MASTTNPTYHPESDQIRRTSSASALDEVARVAAWVLPGGARRTVEPADPRLFVAVVADQRISGLVAGAVSDGALDPLVPELTEQLHAAHLDALRTSLAVEAASVEVSRLLDFAGIRHAFLKGCATARLDYPDPSLRMTGDVDVLIDRSSYAAALECFRRAGIERHVPPFRTRWEQRYGKDIALEGAAGIEIDLHLGLVGGYFGIGSDLGSLLDALDEYPLAGRRLPALDPVGRLVHAAVHSAGGPAIRLGSAADAIVLTRSSAVSLEALAERARALGCQPLVASGIERAALTFGIDLGPFTEWATRVEPDPDEERALAALVHPGGEGVWLSGVRGLPWTHRPGYLAPLLAPSRAHLRARGRTLPGHLRRSAHRLRSH